MHFLVTPRLPPLLTSSVAEASSVDEMPAEKPYDKLEAAINSANRDHGLKAGASATPADCPVKKWPM
ncbi:unnamed protein product [Mesocestoides corti]|uniref:Secreted protein n=1 Tax=Mesocestoides corti TaxID=53468 RepID=A0A0R3UKZ0_MESCO|nr:unnamed protein product [Mesocestoides corti]